MPHLLEEHILLEMKHFNVQLVLIWNSMESRVVKGYTQIQHPCR